MKNLAVLIITIFTLSFINIYAQNSVWSVPPYYKDIAQIVPLPTVLPPGLGYTGNPATNASNAMQDANGDLLFFIVDNMIYDKEGFLIGDLSVEFYNPNGYPQNLRQNILFSYNLFLSINLHKPLTHYLTICNLTIHASAAVALLRII